MNGKVRRFYEELAAMSGLRLDPDGLCTLTELPMLWEMVSAP